MTYIANPTLVDFLDKSTNVCLPNGYMKLYPELSLQQEGFVANNYFKLFYALSTAKGTFEKFSELAAIILSQPYNPLVSDELLLSSLKEILGINFVLEDLTSDVLRRVLYAKLLANINDGTISKTIEIYSELMDSVYVQRIRLGVSPAVSYCAIGGNLPISISELAILWDSAVTAGIYIELRQAPASVFGFFGDPNSMGFSTLASTGEVVRAVPPYFAFEGDPDAEGFSTIDSPLLGGNLPTLVLPLNGGGNFANIIFSL
jgi:hypothetical protein